MRWSVVLVALVLPACGGGEAAVEGAGSGAAGPSVASPSVGAPDGCPPTFGPQGEQPWVPENPTTETPGRLVPDADPVDALVCRYTAVDAGASRLDGERLLTGDLTSVRHDLLLPEELPGQERVCTLIGGPHVPHLVRLRYADGELWLSAVQEANDCTDTGNGDFVTQAYLGGRFATAYDAGTWPAAPAPHPLTCQSSGVGRAGQERALVPQGWEAARVCGPSGAHALDAGTAARVVDLLDRIETGPGSNACQGTARDEYDLQFLWPTGPPVTVAVSPGCVPEIRNGSLDGRPTPGQLEELAALLGR